MIPNKVKLVVWDLDETFWRGTLSEEGIVAIDRNIEMVRELSKRGIVNSICSKNDYEQAKAKLVELDIWDYFVFPSISFNPKGKAVAEMIEGAALRAENVLFLDDNRLNLEEVKFFNKGIMVADPDDVLDGLLGHENLIGKPDPDLTRLKQYQFLQKKVEDRSASALSNDEFLRASNIRVEIDYDIEKNFDRIVDLINRANQLNYTKRRLETPQDIAAFRESLNSYGMHAGCVRANDSYGDYGIVGFFMVKRTFAKKKLIHFVFSCRTMNMGIEQYIYETLECPGIRIVEPVSYVLQSHEEVDWINTNGDKREGSTGDRPLVLIGGCDLMQLASYCSSNRTEFVNGCKDGEMLRFDDPGFILSDREAIRACKSIREIPLWTYEDARNFDNSLASAEIVLVSMYQTMNTHFFNVGEVLVGLQLPRIEKLESAKPDWFVNEFERLGFRDAEKLDYVERSYQAICGRTSSNCRIFVLGTYSLSTRGSQHKRRNDFNNMSRAFCTRDPERTHYVDVDALVPQEHLTGVSHFTRAGYHLLARHIFEIVGSPAAQALAMS